jgi:hypothetical protein
VTAHTTSRISDFTALDPFRYLTACAFVIVLRVAIVSSISQSDLAPLRVRSADTPTQADLLI